MRLRDSSANCACHGEKALGGTLGQIAQIVFQCAWRHGAFALALGVLQMLYLIKEDELVGLQGDADIGCQLFGGQIKGLSRIGKSQR